MKLSVTIFLAVAPFLLTSGAYGQNTTQSKSKSEHPEKITLTECEGGDNCGTWTFLWVNGKGSGKWRNGEEAVLEMQVPAEGKVVILRTDVSGAKEGLTATYEGALSNGKLGGTVTYIYRGEREPGFWNAAVAAQTSTPTASLPSMMHFRGQHSLTFILENGQYINYSTLQGQRPGQKRVLTIEKFTPELIVLHRTDYGDYPSTTVYSGKPGDNGNSLSGSGWKLTWGSALNDLPGCDAEWDRTGICQQTQSQISNEGNQFVHDVLYGVAVDLAKNGLEELLKSLFRSSQQ